MINARSLRPFVPSQLAVEFVGSVWAVRNTATGNTDFSSSSKSAALNYAVNAFDTNGGDVVVVDPKGSTGSGWTTVPALPVNLTGRLRIFGYGCRVALTVSAPRFLDPGKTADYDYCRNIEINGFIIDAAGLAASTLKNHIVFGTRTNTSTWLTRLNFQNIRIENILTLNVPTDPTLTRFFSNIQIESAHPAQSEPTQTVVRDITIRDCVFNGGNYGVSVGGRNNNGGASTANGLNVLVDRILIEDCWHDTGVIASSNWTSANFHVGVDGFGGHATIRRCYGAGSGDVGIEVDSMDDAVVHDCEEVDAYATQFYATNYNTPRRGTAAQKYLWSSCRAVRLNATHGGGFQFGNHESIDLGEMRFDSCSWTRLDTSFLGSTGEFAIQAANGSSVRRIIVNDPKVTMSGFTSTVTGTPSLLSFTGLATQTCDITVNNGDLTITGTYTTGTQDFSFVKASGLFSLRVSGSLTLNEAIASAPANMVKGVTIGDASASSTCTFDVVGVFVKAMSNASPYAILVNGSGTTTVNRGRIRDCDFSGLPATGTEVQFAGTSNAAKVSRTGCRWRVDPVASSSISPGASPYTFQNTNGMPGLVTVQAGTVSKIEVSTDAANFRDTGATQGAFHVVNGDQVRVTYSVAPTMFFNPERG